MTAGRGSGIRDNEGPEGCIRQDQPLLLQAYSDEKPGGLHTALLHAARQIFSP